MWLRCLGKKKKHDSFNTNGIKTIVLICERRAIRCVNRGKSEEKALDEQSIHHPL